MLKCVAARDFKKAETIADSIDWRRVKSVSMLCTVSDIYDECRRYSDAREILFIAYDRAPNSRKIIFGLAELAIKTGDLDEASDCYDEFISVAPKDGNQYVLKYELSKARHEPIGKQIEALEEFKQVEYIERWAYELAKLYEQAGMTAKCIEECDDLVLWFSEGKYVRKALDLKKKYKPLTPLQAEKYTMSANSKDEPSESQREASLLLDEGRKLSERNKQDIPEEPHEDLPEPQSEPADEDVVIDSSRPVIDMAETYDRSHPEEQVRSDVQSAPDAGETVKIPDIDLSGYDLKPQEQESTYEAAPEAESETEEPEVPEAEEPEAPETDTVDGFGMQEEQPELKTEFAEDISDKVREMQERARAEAIRLEAERKAAAEASRIAEEKAAREAEAARLEEIAKTRKEQEADRQAEIARREAAARREDEEAEERAAAEAEEAAKRTAEEEAEKAEAADKTDQDDASDDVAAKINAEDIDVKPVRVGVYDTMNMQAEIARGMAEIMAREEDKQDSGIPQQLEEATEDLESIVKAEPEAKETVPAEKENVPVEKAEAPEEKAPEEKAAAPVSKLVEDNDGQLSLTEEPKSSQLEKQITGQMNIEDILSQWEEKQHAVEKTLEASKKQYEEEMREHDAALKAINAPVNIIPDDIQRILDEIEADDHTEEPQKPEAEEKTAESEAAAQEEQVTLPADNSLETDDEPEQTEKKLADTQNFEVGSIAAALESMTEDEKEDSEPQTEPEPAVNPEPANPTKSIYEKTAAPNETFSGNPDETQGGLTLEEKFDLEAQSRVGTEAGLSEEEKRLFSYFVPVRGMSEQLVEVLKNDRSYDHDGTSSMGNLIVIGRKGSGKTVLAVDVVKAIQKSRKMPSGKVAIISADALNNKDVPGTIRKVHGGSLIIENAGAMNPKTVEALNMAMTTQTGDLLIVLEDQRHPMSDLLAKNGNFAQKFTSHLEVPIFINDELVTFGQAYAKEHGYRIDEMGILALYSRIDAMQREDHAVTVAEVKDIMDEAFVKSKRNSMKRTMTNLFKNHDKSERILLMEEDFTR